MINHKRERERSEFELSARDIAAIGRGLDEAENVAGVPGTNGGPPSRVRAHQAQPQR